MRPAILKPGDVLLYQGIDWLSAGIQWGQWVDGHEDTSRIHAALYFGSRLGKDGIWIVRQNPGGPAFELADLQPWDRIEVRRLTLKGGLTGAMIQPGGDMVFQAAFRAAVADHMNDGYAYQEITDYLGEDLLARLGQGMESEELRKKAALFLDAHKNCCSEFDRIVLNQAWNRWSDQLGPFQFDVLPELGPGQARPSDLGSSKFLLPVLA